MRKTIARVVDAFLTAGGYASAFLIVLVTLLLIYEVVTRYFLHKPSIWALDFTRYSVLYLTFLGTAWLLREEGHVKIELVTSRLSSSREALMNGVTSVIACVACCIFFWEASKSTWNAYQMGQTIERSVVVPRYLIVGIMPLGAFFLCLQFVRQAWNYFRDSLQSRQRKPES